MTWIKISPCKWLAVSGPKRDREVAFDISKLHNLNDDVIRLIFEFANGWYTRPIPIGIDVMVRFDTEPRGNRQVVIDEDGVNRYWPRLTGRRRLLPMNTHELRRQDVLIDALPDDDFKVSAEMGRHKAAQLIKDAIQADALRLVEGKTRPWTRKHWDPDVFNAEYNVLQRKKEKQDRREVRRLFRQQHNMTLGRSRRAH